MTRYVNSNAVAQKRRRGDHETTVQANHGNRVKTKGGKKQISKLDRRFCRILLTKVLGPNKPSDEECIGCIENRLDDIDAVCRLLHLLGLTERDDGSRTGWRFTRRYKTLRREVGSSKSKTKDEMQNVLALKTLVGILIGDSEHQSKWEPQSFRMYKLLNGLGLLTYKRFSFERNLMLYKAIMGHGGLMTAQLNNH